MANKSARGKTAATKVKAPMKKTGVSRKGSKPSSSLRPRATPASASDKDHLIGVIQAGTGASKKAAKETLSALLDTVIVSVKKNKKVQLVGFGSFEVVKRRARKGRNPATDEAIKIKASKGVRFRAGTKLKRGI